MKVYKPVDTEFEFVGQGLNDGFNPWVIEGYRLDYTACIRTVYMKYDYRK